MERVFSWTAVMELIAKLFTIMWLNVFRDKINYNDFANVAIETMKILNLGKKCSETQFLYLLENFCFDKSVLTITIVNDKKKK